MSSMDMFGKLKSEEGFRDTIYKDTLGHPTIGYGFNLDDPTTSGMIAPDVLSGARKITVEESDAILNKLFEESQKGAINFVGEDVYGALNDDQKLALVDMAYNMGSPKLSKFVKMRQAILDGDFVRAAAEIQNSDYFKQVTNRAKRNMELMNSTGK